MDSPPKELGRIGPEGPAVLNRNGPFANVTVQFTARGEVHRLQRIELEFSGLKPHFSSWFVLV